VIALFNVGDLVGKLLPLLPVQSLQPPAWAETKLLKFTLWRVAFVPFMVMCAAPKGSPLLSGFGWICVLTLALGVTGGCVKPLCLLCCRVAVASRVVVVVVVVVCWLLLVVVIVVLLAVVVVCRCASENQPHPASTTPVSTPDT
jgi:hypothetical protein